MQIKDCFIELVEPVEGPRVKLLEEKGEGAIYMIVFRVDDIEELYDELKKRDITPVDWHGSPFDQKYLVSPTGTKILFLPREKNGGTLIEFIERAL